MNAQLASDRVITLRLRALADSLPAVLEADAEGVHKARVASRRVREALPVVLAQAPPGRSARLRRSFRRVTRALGPLREIDVTLQLLDDVVAAEEHASPALVQLRERLEREREVRRQQMLTKLDAIDFESLVSRIERLMDDRADESDEARALPAAIAGTLGLRVARRVRALERAIDQAGGLYAVEALHRVRIAVKKVRYALELAHEMKQLRSRRALTVLREAQEALGQLHDDQVLASWIGRAATDYADPASVAHVLERVEQRSRAAHARYIALRPRLLTAVDAALSSLTPSRAADGSTAETSATVH